MGATGKGSDIPDGILGKAPHGPFGGSDCTFLHFERNLDAAKADPGRKGSEKGSTLWHGKQGIYSLSVQKFKIGSVCHINMGKPADNSIKAVGTEMVESTFLSTEVLTPSTTS